MITPYLNLGGVEIPYTKDDYERHGRKIGGIFSAITGAKKLFYLQDVKKRLVNKFSFTFRTSQIEQINEINRLFAHKGTLILIDFQPIVECMIPFKDDRIRYLLRDVYKDENHISIVDDAGDNWDWIFDDPPETDKFSIKTDGSKQVAISEFSNTDDYDRYFFISYIPQFEVILKEDPLYKWINEDIWYYEFHLEEV